MSRLLLDEPPLVILPKLAVKIGLNEAIVIQQIHYWASSQRHLIDDLAWTYNSIAEWRKQFPFWSEKTIRRTIDSLVDQGLVFKRKLSENPFDATLWYAVNLEKLGQTDVDKMTTSDVDKVTTSHTKNTETNTDGFSTFWCEYPKKVGKQKSLEIWNKLKPDAELQAVIMNALRVAKTSTQWQNGYILDPERWLKYRRWEDEIAEPEKKVGRFAGLK